MNKFVKKTLKIIFIILFIFVVGGVAGVIGERFVMPWLTGFPYLQSCSFFQKANEKVTVVNQTKKITVKEDFSVSNIAEKVSPSVVSIISFQSNEDQNGSSKIKSSQDISQNIKTGLILTGDGLIISVLDENLKEIIEYNQGLAQVNQDRAWKFKVLASDNRELDANIQAIDNFSNLVFFKVERDNLPIPSLGESGSIEVGEKVVICGNAGGEYQNTYSSGLIKEKDQTFSLLNSELASSEKREGAILLDAKIEDRNAGGPVLDYNGTVIGIVSQIVKDDDKIGFVIPIDEIKETINKVLRKEELSHPSFGVYYLSINREIALLNNLKVNRGALVYSFSGQQGLAVIKNSSADEAGIKIGDIIISIDGRMVDLNNPLSKIISSKKIGEEIKIKLMRNDQELELKATLK